MIVLKGTYENGDILLERQIEVDGPRKVIVTFLEEDLPESTPNTKLDITKFSFHEARKITKKLKTSLSEGVISERRSKV